MNPISQINLEREDKRIKLTLPYNPTYIKKTKTIPGYRWHPDKKYWSFLYSEDIFKKILSLFDGENIHLDSILQRLTEETGKNKDFEVLRRELVFRKYSPKTIKTYLYYNRDMLKLTNKSPFNVKDSNIKDYLLYLVEKKKAATSTLNVAINALKFYYGTMLKRKFLYEIKRPRKDKKLPVVLSQEEVAKILSSVDNIKHKALLMLVYSAGLRVGEVIRLKVEDIDSDRMLINIKGAKGRKDRYTMLSKTALEVLRDYWSQYKPEKWLFEGTRADRHLSTRTVEKILERACEKAGIWYKEGYFSAYFKTQLCHPFIGEWNGFEVYSRVIRTQKQQDNRDLYACKHQEYR